LGVHNLEVTLVLDLQMIINIQTTHFKKTWRKCAKNNKELWENFSIKWKWLSQAVLLTKCKILLIFRDNNWTRKEFRWKNLWISLWMTWLSYKREISDQIKKVLASKMKAPDGETNKSLELDLDKVIKPLR